MTTTVATALDRAIQRKLDLKSLLGELIRVASVPEIILSYDVPPGWCLVMTNAETMQLYTIDLSLLCQGTETAHLSITEMKPAVDAERVTSIPKSFYPFQDGRVLGMFGNHNRYLGLVHHPRGYVSKCSDRNKFNLQVCFRQVAVGDCMYMFGPNLGGMIYNHTTDTSHAWEFPSTLMTLDRFDFIELTAYTRASHRLPTIYAWSQQTLLFYAYRADRGWVRMTLPDELKSDVNLIDLVVLKECEDDIDAIDGSHRLTLALLGKGHRGVNWLKIVRYQPRIISTSTPTTTDKKEEEQVEGLSSPHLIFAYRLYVIDGELFVHHQGDPNEQYPPQQWLTRAFDSRRLMLPRCGLGLVTFC